MFGKKKTLIFIVLIALASSYFLYGAFNKNKNITVDVSAYDDTSFESATFAGGCFWCMEPPFIKISGVVDVISGYTGGELVNPTYEEVTAGGTGHVEAVRIVYDPQLVSYETLVQVYWRQIDPTDDEGQFVDRGHSYTTAIFYHSKTQKAVAEASKDELANSNRFDEPIVTPIKEAADFYPAEEYHQDYHMKNPMRYRYYRAASGRDEFLDEIWGAERNVDMEPIQTIQYTKPSDTELKEILTETQYYVTQKDGTETPYQNEYWNNERDGIYVDIVSGEPLFSSTDMYDSETGWPSFTKPLVPENIVEKDDRSFLVINTEIRSKHGDSHLGHVFEDGIEPTGLRYCMNSAALRFIPKEDLKLEGFEEFKYLFED